MQTQEIEDEKKHIEENNKQPSKNLDLSDVSECGASVQEFVQDTTELEEDFTACIREINEQFRKMNKYFTRHQSQKKKYKDISQVLDELRQQYSGSNEVINEIDKMDKTLTNSEEKMSELSKWKVKTGSYFLRLLIGRVSVRLWNENNRLEFKQEYNRFKEVWIWILFFMPILQIMVGFSYSLHQLQSLANIYYYACLSIRENILKVNGSNIESWWIYHHYITLLTFLLFLLMPQDSLFIINGHALSMAYFNVWQTFVLLLQHRYQKKTSLYKKSISKKNSYGCTYN